MIAMAIKPFVIEERDRWLVVRFPEPWSVASWAVVNGGWQRTSSVAWLYLQPNEIQHVGDPAEWMQARMHAQGLASAVGFMTSRRALAWVEAAAEGAFAVATVGLSNALRAGDPAGAGGTLGTINVLIAYEQALTVEAAMEALCIASEAKALAVLESGVASIRSGEPATGTGTDYLAIASPTRGGRARYAGKHTVVGSAVGRVAYLAVRDGVRQWKAEFAG